MKELDVDNLKFILIGTPIHKNLGDHLIALAEEQFFKKNFPTIKVIEIPQDVYLAYQYCIESKIKRKDYIFISGGGWLGNIWAEDDQMIRNILYKFPNNHKLVFPQTIYFDIHHEKYQETIDAWRKISDETMNFKICFREKHSYMTAIDMLKKNAENCFLLPDIGLTYQKKIERNNRNRIGIILRSDRECCLDFNLRIKIMDIVVQSGLEIDEFSTLADTLVKEEERETTVNSLMERFGRCKYVVTDRLHAMIFSVLTNTPCIAFDNLTHKLSGVYETWLKKEKVIHYVHDIFRFQQAVREIETEQREPFDYRKYEKKFAVLVKAIRNDLMEDGDKSNDNK